MDDDLMRVACKRTKVSSAGRIKPWIPGKWVEALEHNQQIAHCCRHPENHEIEAYYSSAEDEAKGVPDIYIFFCSCGRQHRRFCVGGHEGFKVDHLGEFVREGGELVPITVTRPFWEVR